MTCSVSLSYLQRYKQATPRANAFDVTIRPCAVPGYGSPTAAELRPDLGNSHVPICAGTRIRGRTRQQANLLMDPVG